MMWVPHAIGAMARLGLADELAAGPRSLGELADAVGADQQSLRRLVRALCSIGLVEQHQQEKLSLTGLGSLLRFGTSDSLLNVALMSTDPAALQAWSALPDCVRSGRTAGQLAGEGDDPFGAIDADPDS